MAKTTSKKTRPQASRPAKTAEVPSTQPSGKSKKNHQSPTKSQKPLQRMTTRWHEWRKSRFNPHKSFRRSYHEDYVRKTETPGLLEHAMTTFQLIFKHWRTFLPLIIIMTISYIVLVGLMNEELYLQFQDSINETSAELANGEIGNFAKAGLLLLSTITTGGLNTGMDETQMVFMLFLFLVMWLTTIYLMRHFVAGGKPKLRDALYNALTPLISTLLVFCVIFIQAIPAMLVIITYSAAVATGFLSTPFYALVYFIFAALMILITAYLFSSSIIALVAVTAPGVYPITALSSASDLMNGRRVKFIIRIVYLIIVVALIYAIIMTPIILVDLWLKGICEFIAGWPIVPFFLLVVTCFSFVYATVYLYRYYRWLLDYQEK